MIYPKNLRTQHDGLQELVSADNGLDCSNLPDLARQEFKADTLTNNIIEKFGIDSLTLKPMNFFDVDTTIDLQQALALAKQARDAYHTLPENIRARYPDWDSIAQGVARGEIILGEDGKTPTFPLTPEQQEYQAWLTARKSSAETTATPPNAAAAGAAPSPSPATKP